MAPPGGGTASSPEKSSEPGGDIAEIVAKMIQVTEKLAKLGKVNGKDVAPYAQRLMDVLKELDMVAKGGQAGGGAPSAAPPPAPSTPGPGPAAGAEGTQPVPA